MRQASRNVARSLGSVAVAALWIAACTVDDADYVFDGAGGGGPGLGGGAALGGAHSGAPSSAGSGDGGASMPGSAEGGEAGDGTQGAVGGAAPEVGGATGTTGGAPSSSSGTGGVVDAPPSAGAAGAPASDGACETDQICATLTVGSEFPSNPERIAVVLYEAKPVVTELGPPWPLATYAPIDDVELSPSMSLVLRQGFTEPAWGGDFAGARYVAVVAFFSNEERQGVPGQDYWYTTPEPVTLELGKLIELGEIRLRLVPVVNDSDSPGNDAPGLVTCTARRHDEVDADAFDCDVSSTTCCIFQVNGGTCGASGCAEDGTEFEHACDGPEDCSSGQVCCGEPLKAHRCVAESSCNARVVCHSNGDCQPASLVCVAATAGIADVGYCVGSDPATPGDDRPYLVQCFPSTTVCDTQCCVAKATGAAECGPSCPGTVETRNILSCDGPEDCPGQACCLLTRGDRYCGSWPCDNVVVCHVDSDCPAGACGADGLCAP